MRSKIKLGERIIVDKGILGEDVGVLVSVEGWSIGGVSGLYLSDKDGKEHVYDQTVHNISKQTNDRKNI